MVLTISVGQRLYFGFVIFFAYFTEFVSSKIKEKENALLFLDFGVSFLFFSFSFFFNLNKRFF